MAKEHFSFFSEYSDFKLDHTNAIANWLFGLAKSENKSINHIEYVFCTDDYLLEINKKHLDHDYYTDIITFPISEDPLEATIFISIDRVKDNANEFKVTFLNELHRVIAHGILHLLGYKDKTEEEAKEMRRQENNALEMLKF